MSLQIKSIEKDIILRYFIDKEGLGLGKIIVLEIDNLTFIM